MKQKTLAAGDTLQVYISVPSQVEISGGSFGSVALTSSSGLVVERTDTVAVTFKSEMQDMLFTLTGGSGIVIGINPLMGDTNSQPKVFRTIHTVA